MEQAHADLLAAAFDRARLRAARRARASASSTSSSDRRPPRRGSASSVVLDDARDRGEGEPAREERRDRDLVGGVEHRRRVAAGAQRLVGEPQARKALEVRRLERRACRCAARSSAATPGSMRSGIARARARSACACRDCRAARAPSRRRTRPANGSRSADGSRTSICSGGAPNSQCASITSRPLFIMVAESTEILRPITQLGCAHACVGRHVRQAARAARAERPARGGEQDAAHAARRRGRSPNRAAGTGRPRCARCRSAAASRRLARPRP